MKACSYSSIVISDHAPLLLSLQFQDKMLGSRSWKFNSLLLSDKAFCDSLKDKLDIFLEINTIPETSPSIIWESFKAYALGQVISYSVCVNRQIRKKLEELSLEIIRLDSAYATSPDPGIYKKRLKLQSDFNMLSTHQAEKLLLKAKHAFFEHGDKPSKLLALQLKEKSAQNLISKIQSSDGNLITDPVSIATHFKDYYSLLYKSEPPTDRSLMESFFEPLPIPTISNAMREELELPFFAEEIVQAIESMQNGKTPGPDGFPIEFLRGFLKHLKRRY